MTSQTFDRTKAIVLQWDDRVEAWVARNEQTWLIPRNDGLAGLRVMADGATPSLAMRAVDEVLALCDDYCDASDP